MEAFFLIFLLTSHIYLSTSEFRCYLCRYDKNVLSAEVFHARCCSRSIGTRVSSSSHHMASTSRSRPSLSPRSHLGDLFLKLQNNTIIAAH